MIAHAGTRRLRQPEMQQSGEEQGSSPGKGSAALARGNSRPEVPGRFAWGPWASSAHQPSPLSSCRLRGREAVPSRPAERRAPGLPVLLLPEFQACVVWWREAADLPVRSLTAGLLSCPSNQHAHAYRRQGVLHHEPGLRLEPVSQRGCQRRQLHDLRLAAGRMDGYWSPLVPTYLPAPGLVTLHQLRLKSPYTTGPSLRQMLVGGSTAPGAAYEAAS